MLSHIKKMEFKADVCLFLVAIMWGITFLPMAEALKTNGVFTILSHRFIVASFLMLPLWFKFSRHYNKELLISSAKYGCILGFLLFCGYVTQTFGLKFTLSSTVAFITGLNVVFTPFIMFIIFKSKISLAAIIGAVLACLGLYYLSAAELGFGIGEALTTACAVFYSLHIVFTGEWVRKFELYTLVTMQFATVGVLSFLISFFVESNGMAVWDNTFIYTLLITSVLATFVAFLVQNAMQRYTSQAKTALLFTFEPVSAGFVGYYFGDERLSMLQIFGAGLILVGILISEIGSYLSSQKFSKATDKKCNTCNGDNTSSTC